MHTKRLNEKMVRAENGMTLLEVMVVVAILTVVMGVLFGLSTSMGDTAGVQGARITTSDEARRAVISVTRDLRQAGNSSVTGLPGAAITYRVAVDTDGNGSAVDVGSTIELSGIRTIERDLTDANGDGIRGSQLVMKTGGVTQVLANNLLQDEDANGNGVLDPGEDRNLNGQLDRGLWFERDASSIRVTIETESQSRRGHLIQTRLAETVFPRN